jgi:mRNA interferase MazF
MGQRRMGMEIKPARFDICLITLDPTQGSEIKKTRPCVIISPDEMNKYLNTVIIAPMTTKTRNYPTRIAIQFDKKHGEIVLDQIRTVDKSRLVKHLGKLSLADSKKVINILQQLFAW